MEEILQQLSLSSLTMSLFSLLIIHTGLSIVLSEFNRSVRGADQTDASALTTTATELPLTAHYGDMAVLPRRHEAHIPHVPSPLNPSPTRRRPRPGNLLLCRGSGRIQMSPSEKLLRQKAALAWASETTFRQEALYRRRALEDAVISKSPMDVFSLRSPIRATSRRVKAC